MDYELRFLHATADGVEPALLLAAPGKKAEYLLNVPDGFSRLALEHKSTPSGRLSCILLTSLLPAATGGLGGLMLRLRHDGHGQVQMIGPSGTTATLHSLRHICRWRHPKVFVSECCGNRPIPVFEDEHVVIVPIVDGYQTTRCPWCLYGAAGENSISDQQKETTDLLKRPSSKLNRDRSNTTSGSSDFSLSGENSSDTDGSSKEEVSSEVKGANGILPQRRKREDNQEQPPVGEHFKQVILRLEKSKTNRVDSIGFSAPRSRTKRPPTDQRTGEPGDKSFTQKEDKETRDSGFEVFDCGEEPASDVGAKHVRELQRNPRVSSAKSFEWLIHNSQEAELPEVDEEANPVFQLSPGPDIQEVAVSGLNQNRPGPSSVLGYVCYLRKLGKAVLVVDCNSKQQFESLRTHPLLCCQGLGSSFEESEECKAGNEHLIAAVVDFSPRNIIQSRDYELWVESIRSTGHHVVMKRTCGEFGFQSSLATLVKLNCIHKRIFPLPPGIDLCSGDTKGFYKRILDRDEKVLDGALCMRLILQKTGTLVDYSLCPGKLTKLQEERRQMVLDSSSTGCDEGLEANGTRPTISPNGAAAAALRRSLQQRIVVTLPSGMQTLYSQRSALALQQQKHELQSLNYSERYAASSYRTPSSGQDEVTSSDPDSDFQLVFFGTGCAQPSKKRGSSGILLQVKGTDRAMLMEAGEGVAGQFVRRFGEVNATSFICSLECLWLSHKHGDHVLGVPSILEARTQQREPLVVIGPQKVGLWLSEVKEIRAAMGCPVPEFHFISCQDLAVSGRSLNKESRKQFDRVICSMRLHSLKLIRVFHCFDSYGIVLRGKTGWSVVYSGDTRPCKALEYAGQGCSLLIHEATFEDELIEQAKLKRHCTVSEALKAGLQMGAQHIILTHFSQRYPEMVAMCRDQNQRVSVAFDGMVVPSHLLDSLAKMLPSITSVCQKRDTTKALSSNQVMDQSHSEANSHVVLVQANTHPNTERLGVDVGLSPACLDAASLHTSITRPNTEQQECAGTKPTHIRWSDSDGSDVEAPSADVDDDVEAITWSSDFEETGPSGLPAFKCRSLPQVCAVEIDTKAVDVLARVPSLKASREANSDTPVDMEAVALPARSPSRVTSREANVDIIMDTKAVTWLARRPVSGTNFDTSDWQVARDSAEDEQDHCHLTDRPWPGRQESRTVSRRGFKRMPRNNAKRGQIQTSVDQFLMEVERYENIERIRLYDSGEGCQPSQIVVEGSRADGVKHIRWVDSDTEE